MKEGNPLLPLLRSRVQGDLLALLYLHPDQDYSLAEAARLIGAGSKAVHAEAARLVSTGFIADQRRGTSRLIRAITTGVLARPLTDLLAVTYGPLPVLTDLLCGVDGVETAYIFGSWAARYQGEIGGVPNDVDVLVVGDADRDLLWDIAEDAGRRLGRDVDIRVVTAAYWATPPDSDPFLKHMRSRPLIELKVAP